MADTKITALTAISTVDPAVDVLPIVDVSDTTMAASGTTKKITSNQILGAGGTATLASATITGNLTVDTSTLKVDSTNNRVGIGTATPTHALDVTSSATTVIRSLASAGNQAYVSVAGNGGVVGTSSFDLIQDGSSNAFVYNRANTYLAFGTNNSERYRIAADGVATWSNVGGVAGTAMTLNSTGLGLGVTPSAWWSNEKALQIGSGAFFSGRTANPDVAEIGANQFINSSLQRIYIGNGYASRYQQDGGVHQWFTAPSGTAGNAITFTQAMTLDASGNLHVGTTAYVGVGTNFVNSLNGFNIVPNNTGSASNRNWQLAANGSAAGNLDFTVSSANNTYPNSAYRMQLTSAGALNNTTGTYGTISDLRLKENISDARNYLADLLKLRVVKYSLKEESSAVATKLGFIAQEVEQVFPNLVDQSDVAYDGGEGIRSVKTSILIPMLLKAIQELTARVEALEA
jgi:hypothetical protein